MSLVSMLGLNFTKINTMTYPKTPNSDQECLHYADSLAEIHGKAFFPVKRTEKIKNKSAINFTAVEKSELADYLVDGWEIVD